MRNPRRPARAAALIACLVASTSACQLSIKISTTVDHSGAGRFSLQFFVDKELMDLARGSGQGSTFETLCNIPRELEQKGWTVQRSTQGGGLTIALERSFSTPAQLDTALGDLRACLSERSRSSAPFFEMKVRRSSSLIRTTTSVEGTVDLTSSGLLAQANLSDATRRQLQNFIEQSGNQFFSLTLATQLPGSVSSTTGNPKDVRGGTVEWSPQLGESLSYRAASSAYNVIVLALIGAPLLLLLGFAIWRLARRRSEPPSAPETTAPATGDEGR